MPIQQHLYSFFVYVFNSISCSMFFYVSLNFPMGIEGPLPPNAIPAENRRPQYRPRRRTWPPQTSRNTEAPGCRLLSLVRFNNPGQNKNEPNWKWVIYMIYIYTYIYIHISYMYMIWYDAIFLVFNMNHETSIAIHMATNVSHDGLGPLSGAQSPWAFPAIKCEHLAISTAKVNMIGKWSIFEEEGLYITHIYI